MHKIMSIMNIKNDTRKNKTEPQKRALMANHIK